MKTFKITLFFIVALLAFSACQEDQEFTSVDKNGAYIVGFEGAKTISHFEDKGAVVSKIPLKFLGGGDGQFLKEDLEVTIKVLADKSSATEGTEFSLETKKVTLKAGDDFALIPLTVNTGSLNLSVPSKVVLEISIEQGNNVVIGSNNNQIAITFVGCKANVEDFTYDNKMVGAKYDGSPLLIDYPGEAIVLHDGTPNLYRTESTYKWGVGSLSPAKYDGFIFEVICGEVFIKDQQLGGHWGNVVQSLDGDASTKAGEVDADGNITIEYKVVFDGKFYKVKSTYTKK
ncbi:hypothetical protein [Tenacibaculum finnmarkense]|uniref:hypothetical protein n=1 Tax=Tenacibaculum finnmarkense TaxID=2781243 RepID=UPI000C4BBE85|nr:hypothetical protein [Tenacibaculum finnmarkense]MCD8440327.1 hypothetical protein [Tenacibaculum finnmarkense genomovar ulcerans]MCG8721179.1 hypothetical protein [Tenacibaculum finnmarkense]SOS55057.1 Probable lipoprotein precursor [Tenacibaculum finnmarkense]